MYLTDSIGDMICRIRNAVRINAEEVDIPLSLMKIEIAKLLKDEGYISKHETLTKRNKKILRITLKYNEAKKNVITNLKRISTPGRRVYVGKDKMPRVVSGFGIAVLSTSKGIMTDTTARKKGIGGEVIAHVW